MLFVTDIFLTINVFVGIRFDQLNFALKWVSYLMLSIVISVQVWYLYIEFLMDGDPGWMNRYQELLPAIAACFN